jgi:uncharacterized protein
MQLTPRSLLLGAVGLASSIWILDGITDVLGDWIPAIVLGSGATWAYLALSTTSVATVPISKRLLTEARVKGAINEVEGVIERLEQEGGDPARSQSAKLRLQVYETLRSLDRQTLNFTVMGSKGVGKTSLTQLLQTQWLPAQTTEVQIQDSPELFSATAQAAEGEAWKLAHSADLVLFVTDGDVTESQRQAIQRLVQGHRRTLVVFNKQDQYLPREQTELLDRLRTSLQSLIPPEDIVAIATQPRPIKVRQHQHDGSVQEWLEEPEPQIASLCHRLTAILAQEGPKLILASALGDAEALKGEAEAKLNHLRRDRATPLIDKAQWLVAGTTFANPFPALDLLATAAINGQMVMELGQMYQRPMTLEQGKAIAKTLAALMVKQGVVEFSTQAIGLLLKHNPVTYVAGGLVQGVSAAYLTRIAGFTLIEYFEAGEPVQPSQLGSLLSRVFSQNQRNAFLELFVKQGFERLSILTPTFKALTETLTETPANTPAETPAQTPAQTPTITILPEPSPLQVSPKPMVLDLPDRPELAPLQVEELVLESAGDRP